jgi:hypothetical protein
VLSINPERGDDQNVNSRGKYFYCNVLIIIGYRVQDVARLVIVRMPVLVAAGAIALAIMDSEQLVMVVRDKLMPQKGDKHHQKGYP